MTHQIHIQSTLNNTIITVTDLQGNAKLTASSGSLGFTNSRKSTTYASQSIAEHIAKQCILSGYNEIEVILKGIGFGKESALRGLVHNGLFIRKIHDRTPIAHNGCRLHKKRRL